MGKASETMAIYLENLLGPQPDVYIKNLLLQPFSNVDANVDVDHWGFSFSLSLSLSNDYGSKGTAICGGEEK